MRGPWNRRSRGMVLALLLGLAGPGAVAAQGPAGDGGRRLPSPVVVDAHGRVVGAAAGFGVWVQVRSRAAFLGVGQGQFLGDADVVFESTDCSGPAFLRPSFAPPVPDPLRARRDGTRPAHPLRPRGPAGGRGPQLVPGTRVHRPLPGGGRGLTELQRAVGILDLRDFPPPYTVR